MNIPLWHCSEIVGIVADASIYHIACAAAIYGESVIDSVVSDTARPLDREGNEIGVVFAGDEYPDYAPSCDKCLTLLEPELWSN